jgi:glycosyltransferase involved in cell wall biosynthesis
MTRDGDGAKFGAEPFVPAAAFAEDLSEAGADPALRSPEDGPEAVGTEVSILRQELEAALESLREAEQRADLAEAELADLCLYGAKLETSYLALLESRTWRLLEPLRGLARVVRRRKSAPPFTPRLIQGWGGQRTLPQRIVGVLSKGRRTRIAFDKGRSGFYEAGLAELLETASSWTVTPGGRIEADRCAILLRSSSPDPEERRRALEALSASSGWAARGGAPAEAATLRLSILQSLGRDAEAADMARNPPAKAAESPDFLLLAAAHAGASDEPGPAAEQRVAAVSAAFQASANLAVALADPARPATIDNLRGAELSPEVAEGALVSVIVPAFRCADTIAASLRSIQDQTWRNLEILVVDDASPDDTAAVVAELAAQDPRIRLVRLSENGGAYVARNTALAQAAGEFVTVQDSDDWSHPERIRRQVVRLRARPDLVANVSQWARATPDLRFERRAFSQRVVHFNSSSILFRRKAALARAGYWDSVRFGGDTEYWHRLQAVFGPAAVEELPDLLAIGTVREGSLSRASASAYRGGKTGARKSYDRAFHAWHQANPARKLVLPFPLVKRPFGVPAVLRTGKSLQGHFDAVLISDFRHSGGTSASNYQELLAQTRAGLRTAVVQVDRYDFNPGRGIHPDIQALIDGGQIEELVHGDEVTCDVAVVRFPPIFSVPQDFLPRVVPANVRVVVNQPPRRVAGEAPFYSIETCKANIAAYLGQPGVWVPIGPQVRDALAADREAHHLSAEDWFNIIDVDAWKVERTGWVSDRPVIGRHGRDAPEKWMTRRADLLAAYPEDPGIAVRIMGGADIPAGIIGHRPANWEVLPFNALEPRTFLAGLDFFVFFPHENRIEAFGRTIIEAMASGCLAILPPVFEPLFGRAAIYCSPEEVVPTIRRLYADRAAYLARTAEAESIVRERFGFERHVDRLRRAMGGPAAEVRQPVRRAG